MKSMKHIVGWYVFPLGITLSLLGLYYSPTIAYLVFRLDLNGLTEIQFTRFPIVFEGERRGILLIDGLGKEIDFIVEEDAQIASLSPAALLAFHTGNHLVIRDLGGRRGDLLIPTALGKDPGAMHWSYDGRFVAWKGNEDLNIVDSDGQLTRIPLSADLRGKQLRGFNWVQWGYRLIYFESTMTNGTNRLMAYDVSTSKMEEVCQFDFYSTFVAAQDTDDVPLSKKCLSTNEGVAVFGSLDHPTSQLITYSPSRRFYFYFIPQDEDQHIRVAGYDTLRKRAFSVYSTYALQSQKYLNRAVNSQ